MYPGQVVAGQSSWVDAGGDHQCVERNPGVVVHDLDALRTAARRAFDHGRFASEQERAKAWESIEHDPAALIGQVIDFARLTEDVPGLLPHQAEWTVSKAS